MKIHKGKTIIAAVLFAASYLYSKSDQVEITPKLEQNVSQESVQDDLGNDENNNIVTAFVGRRHLVVVVVTVLDYFLFHCSRPVSELSGTVVKLTQVPSCLVDRCFRLT